MRCQPVIRTRLDSKRKCRVGEGHFNAWMERCAVRCGLCRSLTKQDRASRLLPWRTDAGIAIGNRRGTEVLLLSPQGGRIYPYCAHRPSDFSLLFTRIRRDSWYGLHCAHRATTALSWGLCEHRDHASCLASLPSSLVLLLWGTAWLVSHCACPTRAFRGRRVARAQDTDQAAPSYVSIISNRASNSCPQAVQRMQSDSTVNSSDLIPMPPQSGQRASWTL